jgi:hypothetical protein
MMFMARSCSYKYCSQSYNKSVFTLSGSDVHRAMLIQTVAVVVVH